MSTRTLTLRRIARYTVDRLAGSMLGSIRSVDTERPLVALTFDDGPDDEWTPRVLDILSASRSRAMFFVLVTNARRRPDLVRRIVAEGHDVGLHGIGHCSIAGGTKEATRDMLHSAAAELSAIAGVGVRYFRPPFGDQSLASFLGMRDAGLECVVWSVDSLDWRGEDPRRTAANVVSYAVPGDIVLMHDGVAGDAVRCDNRGETVELIIDGLRRAGLRGASLSKLLASGRPRNTVWMSFPGIHRFNQKEVLTR